jgi:hypothetical protein
MEEGRIGCGVKRNQVGQIITTSLAYDGVGKKWGLAVHIGKPYSLLYEEGVRAEKAKSRGMLQRHRGEGKNVALLIFSRVGVWSGGAPIRISNYTSVDYIVGLSITSKALSSLVSEFFFLISSPPDRTVNGSLHGLLIGISEGEATLMYFLAPSERVVP